MDELYKKAVMRRLRFKTTRGNLSVEDLWDIPLTSSTGLSVDIIAKALNNELKTNAEESFVTPKNKKKTITELKFELVTRGVGCRFSKDSRHVTERAELYVAPSLIEGLKMALTDLFGSPPEPASWKCLRT